MLFLLIEISSKIYNTTLYIPVIVPAMRILFVLEHFSPYVGGAEVLFDNVVTGLIKGGHQVSVLTSRFDKKLPNHEKRNDGVEIYRVGHNRYDFMLYALGEKGRILAKTADIIHTTTYNAAIPAKILSIIAGKKIVITIHEIFEKNWTKFMGPIGIFYRFVESCILHLSFDKAICVSDATKHALIKRGYSKQKLVTIYNGIDYSMRAPKNISYDACTDIRKKYKITDNYIGFFFGRPGVSKGLEYYIKAIPQIIAKIPQFKAFLLVAKNDTKRYRYMKKLVDTLGVGNHIVWGDPVPYKELINYIAMADFTIVPSLAEGFGFAAVEASTVGNPVIATNAGSLPEVMSGKVVFVKPGNEDDIAKKVYEIYQGRYEKIPDKKFFREDNITKTLAIYDELLGK